MRKKQVSRLKNKHLLQQKVVDDLNTFDENLNVVDPELGSAANDPIHDISNLRKVSVIDAGIITKQLYKLRRKSHRRRLFVYGESSDPNSCVYDWGLVRCLKGHLCYINKVNKNVKVLRN